MTWFSVDSVSVHLACGTTENIVDWWSEVVVSAVCFLNEYYTQEVEAM